MARKQITSVKRVGGFIDRVTWLEDGKMFPQEEAADKVARAVNSGEAFYVRRADGTEIPVVAKLRHGRYLLTSQPDASQPDNLLALPTF